MKQLMIIAAVFDSDHDTANCSTTNTNDNDTGVCEKTLLLRKPLPCSPAAEAALKPPIRCSEILLCRLSSSPEECFFTDTSSIQ